MTAVEFSSSNLGYALDMTAYVLAWPSKVLLGSDTTVPIWTTKYIFAMNYTTHTPKSKEFYQKIQEVNCSHRWQIVLRIVWAVSIILPVLDALSYSCAYFAKCDPAIRANYELAVERKANELKASSLQALSESVRDFAGFLMVLGCKKEVDECLPSDELERMRDEKFRHFCTHFSDGLPKDAVLQSSSAIIELLESAYDVKPDEALLNEQDASDDELKANIGRCFRIISGHCKADEACTWMKGEAQSPLASVRNYLVSRFDRFAKVCESSYLTAS